MRVFCRNWDIARKGVGRAVSPAAIAGMMLALQAKGRHNINLVTPSHVAAQIIAAVHDAASRGLRLPLVYNTGGYDRPEALALLDGIVDIYMPDMKCDDSDVARQYSRARDYVEVNRAAVREMHHQLGDLLIDADGIAMRGLLVHHLVMPSAIAGNDRVLPFLAGEISRDTCLNLTDQYHPCHRAEEYPAIDCRTSAQEYGDALHAAARIGLTRLDRRH